MDKAQDENRPAASEERDPVEAPTVPPAVGDPPSGAAHRATQGLTAALAGHEPAFDFLAPPQAPDEIGRLGPYRVLKVLGQGGMGVVFQAEDVRLQRVVALKAMLPALAQDPSAKERFLREARAAAAIEHDHIVAIHQVDEDRGVPFIAMPFLKGLSLEDFLKKKAAKNTPLLLLEICKVGREMAKGLAAAHEHGLIHRDVKPANIWLDQGAGGRVKILDFGLARLSRQGGEKNLTQIGVILGTPAYMAPEQAQAAGQVDASTDLFSLGVVLYRLCTGVLPFRGTDMISTLVAVATQEPPSPRSLRADLPQELSDLVMQLLAKEPAKRPASAKVVVRAIQAIEKNYLGSRAATVGAPAPAPAAGRPAVLGDRQDTTALPQTARSAGESRPPSGAKRSFLPTLFGVAAGVIVMAVVLVAIVLCLPPRPPIPSTTPESEGQPLSPLALVSRPGKIPGVESWTIEPRGHRGPPHNGTMSAYNADGKQLATGSSDGTVRLWEPANGQLLRILLGHRQGITTLAWAPDGKILASGSADATVRLWAPDTGKVLLTFTRHTGPISALAWSRDGKTLASGSADKLVLLWDPVSGEERRRFDRHPATLVDVFWHSDDTLVSTDSNNALWTWEAGTGKALHSHKGKPPLHWSADRQMLIYRSDHKEVTFWEPQGDRVRSLTLKEHSGPIGSCALSPDGKLLVTGGGGLLHCWDAASGKLLSTHSTRPGWPHATLALYFSPDGKALISRRADGMLLVYQTGAFQKDGAKPVAHGGPISWVQWSPDSKTFVALTSGTGLTASNLEFFDPARRLHSLPPPFMAAATSRGRPTGNSWPSATRSRRYGSRRRTPARCCTLPTKSPGSLVPIGAAIWTGRPTAPPWRFTRAIVLSQKAPTGRRRCASSTRGPASGRRE